MKIQKILDVVSKVTKWALIVLALLVLYNAVTHGYKIRKHSEYDDLYRNAIEDNDYEQAVEYVKKMCKYAHFSDSVDEKLLLARTCELAGRYDEALNVYEKCWRRTKKGSGDEWRLVLSQARIAFKRGDREEAFRLFCRGSDYDLWRRSQIYRFDMKSETADLQWRSDFWQDVTLENNERDMRLTCFWEYDDFLHFIDEEYDALGKPSDLGSSVSFIHEVGSAKDKIELLWKRKYGEEQASKIKKARAVIREKRELTEKKGTRDVDLE